MNICKYDIYFIIVLLLIAYVYFNPIKNEGFQSTTLGYQADIEAIRNLSSIAQQLTSNNTLTMPGKLNVTSELNVGSNINLAGNLIIPNKNVIDLGAGDTTREGNAGKIGYNIFEDALNIVGKGKTGEPRRTTIWDNVKVYGKLATNNFDPNNMPDNWTGGIRTYDIFSSATIAAGTDDGKTVKTFINKEGDGYFSRNVTIDKGLRAPGGIGAIMVDGIVISLPIVCSMSNTKWFGMEDRDDNYFIMPGYKLEIWTGYNYTNDRNEYNNTPQRWDNTNGFNIMYTGDINPTNRTSSLKLYYLGNEVRIPGVSDNNYKM